MKAPTKGKIKCDELLRSYKVYTTVTSSFKNVINGEARRMLEVYIPKKTSSPMIAPEMTKRSQFLTLQTPYRSEQ